MDQPSKNNCTRIKNRRKRRISITPEITLELLKLCVEHNTFDQASHVTTWKEITDNLHQKFSIDVGHRTLKAKVKKLMTDYKTQQLKFKTGKVEQEYEIKNLLEILVGYEDAGNVQDELTETMNSFDEDEVSAVLPNASSPMCPKAEKNNADAERDVAVNSDLALPPMKKRNFAMVSVEDEMIKQKQANDHALEEKKLEMKERKRNREFDIEQQKIEVEKEKLKISADENKRRDEIQLQQLELQRTMCQVFEKLVKHD